MKIFPILLIVIYITDTLQAQHVKGKFPDLIDGLKNQKFKNIVFLVGAGASTSAGIPDFRSKSGLFNTLQEKYKLSSPTEFFQLETFLKNPKLFYSFQKDFQSKSYEPTIFHYFMGFLDSKNMIKYVFTQNIDGLDLRCGVRKEKVVFAHGNFLKAKCPMCHKEFDVKEYNEHVEREEIMFCDKCGSPVKADIVFYGEGLSDDFFDKSFEILESDLVIIGGSSLETAPFNKLAYGHTRPEAYRVVINKLRTGKMFTNARGFQYEDANSNDIMLTGTCDDMALMFIKECGWEKEFQDFMNKLKK